MWDIEVDVACVGAGPSILASAIASTDMGATTLLATPSAEHHGKPSAVAVGRRTRGFLGSWVRPDLDAETDRYLSALAVDFCAPGDFAGDARMTVRAVSATPSGGHAGAFIGSRLGAWNATCLESPYGMLFSSVSGWRPARMRTDDGWSLEVQPVGPVSRADVVAGFDANEWLRTRVGARRLVEHRFSELRRIVFDEGRVAGVELVTGDGVLAVGVRHGLALSYGEAPVAEPPREMDTARVEDLRLCIVGQPASRFLRIELLGTALPQRPLCTESGRRLRESLRVTRPIPSGVRRCGKPG